MLSLVLAAVLNCGDLCSSQAVSIYAQLNSLAGLQRYSVERAAFLVRANDGKLHAQVWLAGDETRASWSGTIPSGCIALVHTHPVAAPLPSAADVTEAQRIGIPIIVITPRVVSIAEPDGTRHELLPEGWQTMYR